MSGFVTAVAAAGIVLGVVLGTAAARRTVWWVSDAREMRRGLSHTSAKAADMDHLDALKDADR